MSNNLYELSEAALFVELYAGRIKETIMERYRAGDVTIEDVKEDYLKMVAHSEKLRHEITTLLASTGE